MIIINSQVYDVKTADGITLRLTRYAQPEGVTPKGPLLAVHGMGVSSRIYLMDTIQVSMAEYLYKDGFDILSHLFLAFF
jgi:cholesterol oxidase